VSRKDLGLTADADAIARRVAGRIALIPGVTAIALGGSRARGSADAHSDLDLALYYDRRRPFRIVQLQHAAKELDDRHAAGLMTGFGAWGPGVNGGGWLVVGGIHVDLLYRDLVAVRRAILECRRGLPRTDYQLGHPLGFHNQIYVGEAAVCRPLVDPRGALARLKKAATHYPSALRHALIEKHLFDATFELQIADKPALRGDTMYVVGCLFRAAGFLTLVIYALNRQWFLNEKSALAATRKFRLRPGNFASAVERILAHPGADPAALAQGIVRMKSILRGVRELASRQAIRSI
jgi:predicted nucleotidyltransferase